MSSEFFSWKKYRSLKEAELSSVFRELSRRGAPIVIDSDQSIVSTGFENLNREELFALAAQWGRTNDWRLLEVLLAWLWQDWREFNPILLNELFRQIAVPAVLGILYEWTLFRKNEMSEAHKAFWALALENIPPADGQVFFSEDRILKSTEAQREILYALPFYKKWGFIGKDFPSIGVWKSIHPDIPPEVRHRILNKLAQQGPISLSGYLQALPYPISRQTGWRDLQSAQLQKTGKTKGRTYRHSIK